MTRLLTLFMVCVACGCADRSGLDLHPHNYVTPAGVRVWIPEALSADPDLPARLLDIDGYPPPSDYVVVLHSDLYVIPPGDDRGYAGFCYLRPYPEIHMGATWQAYPAEEWVWVYHHEVNHARTQNPEEGH